METKISFIFETEVGDEEYFEVDIFVWKGEEKEFKRVKKDLNTGETKRVNVNREKEEIPVIVIKPLFTTGQYPLYWTVKHDGTPPFPWWAYCLIFVPVGLISIGAVLLIMVLVSFLVAK